MKLPRQHFVFGVIFTILLIAIPADSYAQRKVKELNKTLITKFIEKMADITSGNSLEESPERIQSFLKRHLHNDARFRSTIQYNIPGFPSQANSMSLNKDQFMSTIKEGAKSMDDYQSEVEVLNVKISSDRQKATVITQGRETGTMSVSPDGINTEAVPIEGYSKCNQIIMINNRGHVQLYNANCETVISFQEY